MEGGAPAGVCVCVIVVRAGNFSTKPFSVRRDKRGAAPVPGSHLSLFLSISLVSSVLEAICFLPSPSVMPSPALRRLQSACNTCLSHKRCLYVCLGGWWWGGLHGFVTVCVWMSSADNCQSVLDHNCIGFHRDELS